MALPNAVPEVFDNAFEGVNSAVSAEMISPQQLAWAKNVINRGGKPGTRPPLIHRMALPSGLVQGASYFGVQGGMGVAMISGRAWRLRINPNSYTAEQITLPFNNSGVIKKVYMQQTVESLVIQDGQSDAIIYNGSVATRSDPSDGGVPRGTVMAYGNGRLWVAINSKELVAGDIRTNTAGSELRFTETNYLSGGGTLYFPRGITALGFIATTGTSDYGALLVFGLDYTESVRADITFRDLWAQTPGFVTNVLRHTGCASHWSLAEINQDLYWRDANGGLRSIRSALADESGPGNSPISREISRLTDFDSRQLLGFSSAISFNNRLISTMSPRLNPTHGISWGSLAPLDFAPMSTMRGKSLPAYDGQWDGLNFTHLFQGQFQGRSRAFAVATNGHGGNSLWEIMEDGRGGLDDVTVLCRDTETYPITSFVEYGSRAFGDNKRRKTLERCDIFLKDLQGDLDLQVYWRSDNNQKWLKWDETEVCATKSDSDQTTNPHVWKNILSQQRPQIKTYTIPNSIDIITKYALQTGFEFQIRLVWMGSVKIDRMTLWARYLDDPQWAIRDVVLGSCLTNDVTGNEIVYSIPVFKGLVVSPISNFTAQGGEGGPFVPAEKTYTLTNTGEITLNWSAEATPTWISLSNGSGSLEPGESVDVLATINSVADSLPGGVYSGEINFIDPVTECGGDSFDATLNVGGNFPEQTITFFQYDGPFEYPAWLPRIGYSYFLHEAITGSAKSRYAPVAGNVGARPCDTTTGPNPAYGTVEATYSGSVNWNLSDSSITGAIAASVEQVGVITAYDNNVNTTREYTAGSIGGILALVPISAQRYYANQGPDFYTQNWSTVTHESGWFPGSVGGVFDSIYCEGYAVTATTDGLVTVQDLGIPVARSGGAGTDAQTQTTGDFNTSTRVNSGQFSYAQFTVGVDSSREQITGTFTFTVTPSVGDPYDLTVIKDYSISGASSVTGTVDFPWIPNAVVHMDSWSYSYQKMVCADYSAYEEDLQIVQLPQSQSWPNPIFYQAPPPNTNCWEDYSQYPTNVNQAGVNLIITGERWNGNATISGVDYTECFEDYSSYPVGENTLFSQGIGWNGAGSTSIFDYGNCSEDYSQYTVGTISVYDYVGPQMLWAGDGSSF